MLESESRAAIEKNCSHSLKVPIMGGDFERYFKSPEFRRVMIMALDRTGTTRKEIRDHYGKSGVEKLDELLKKEILLEKDGIIKGRSEKSNLCPGSYQGNASFLHQGKLQFGKLRTWSELAFFANGIRYRRGRSSGTLNAQGSF